MTSPVATSGQNTTGDQRPSIAELLEAIIAECETAPSQGLRQVIAAKARAALLAISEGKFLFRCNTCNKVFATPEAKQQHKMDTHQPHRRLSAEDRPRDRGTIACGYPGCDASFAHEWNAIQHRRDTHYGHEAHGQTPSASQAVEDEI